MTKKQKIEIFKFSKALFIVTCFALISFSLASCSEDEVIDQQKPLVVAKVESLINVNNPFNNVGEVHNELLQLLGETMHSELGEFVSKKGITANDMENLLQSSLYKTSELLTYRFNIPPNYSESIIDHSIEVYQQNRFLNDANDVTKRIQNLITDCSDVDELIEKVYSVELELCDIYSKGDTKITEDLMAVTVLKYSLLFWKDAIQNINNPWNAYLTAAYVNGDISYIGSKGILKDVWGKIKDGTKKLVGWVEENCDKLISTTVMIGISDYSGVKLTAFTANPAIIGISAGICSATGALSGWINSIL